MSNGYMEDLGEFTAVRNNDLALERRGEPIPICVNCAEAVLEAWITLEGEDPTLDIIVSLASEIIGHDVSRETAFRALRLFDSLGDLAWTALRQWTIRRVN